MARLPQGIFSLALPYGLIQGMSATMSLVQLTVRRGPALAERLSAVQVLAARRCASSAPAGPSGCATVCTYSLTRLTNSFEGGITEATRKNSSQACTTTHLSMHNHARALTCKNNNMKRSQSGAAISPAAKWLSNAVTGMASEACGRDAC